MQHPLFVYGTLRDDDVIQAVLGRPLAELSPTRAHLPGYTALRVAGQVYPGLRTSSETASGLLLHGLTAADLNRLDAFEGEAYERVAVTVSADGASHAAFVYLPRAFVELTKDVWSLEDWRRSGKADFLRGYPGFA